MSQLFSLAEANPPIHSLSPNEHQKTMETEAYTGKGSNCRNSMDPPNPTVDMHANEEENGKLLKSLQKVNKLKDSHLIVMGDFNLPKIDWMSGLVNDTHHSYSTQFIETTESMGWIQKVNDITRF